MDVRERIADLRTRLRRLDAASLPADNIDWHITN
jgi:hypothetical protein